MLSCCLRGLCASSIIHKFIFMAANVISKAPLNEPQSWNAVFFPSKIRQLKGKFNPITVQCWPIILCLAFISHSGPMTGKKEDRVAADNSQVRKVSCCYLNVKIQNKTIGKKRNTMMHTGTPKLVKRGTVSTCLNIWKCFISPCLHFWNQLSFSMGGIMSRGQ